jgi:methylated-DNA-protein-cysteine methyltransferase related protein
LGSAQLRVMKTLDFYRNAVFDVVKTIPRGRVMTYKEVAEKAGLKNPRHVGRILNTNTNPAEYPCHRVVRSDGTVASGYAFGGPEKQREILESEGVVMRNGKILLQYTPSRNNSFLMNNQSP